MRPVLLLLARCDSYSQPSHSTQAMQWWRGKEGRREKVLQIVTNSQLWDFCLWVWACSVSVFSLWMATGLLLFPRWHWLADISVNDCRAASNDVFHYPSSMATLCHIQGEQTWLLTANWASWLRHETSSLCTGQRLTPRHSNSNVPCCFSCQSQSGEDKSHYDRSLLLS